MHYLKKQHSHIKLAQQRQNVTASSGECMQHLNQCSNHCLDPNQTLTHKTTNSFYTAAPGHT